MTVVKKFGKESIGKRNKPIILTCKESDVKKYWLVRMRLARDKLFSGNQNIDPINTYFDGETVEMPGFSEKEYLWGDWISKSSRNRPRDMVNLMQELLISTRDSMENKITNKTAHTIMPDFSAKRLEILDAEFSAYCDSILSIADFMAQKSKATEFSYTEIMDILSTAPSQTKLKINGLPVADGISSAKTILYYLHMANFINPRVACEISPEHPKGYKHIYFEEQQNFHSDSNVSQINSSRYSIHPTFHQYIIEKYNSYSSQSIFNQNKTSAEVKRSKKRAARRP